MLCKEFETMTPKERTEYIGELIHACMNDAVLFSRGKDIIKTARYLGLFDGVTINPAPPIDENNRA